MVNPDTHGHSASQSAERTAGARIAVLVLAAALAALVGGYVAVYGFVLPTSGGWSFVAVIGAVVVLFAGTVFLADRMADRAIASASRLDRSYRESKDAVASAIADAERAANRHGADERGHSSRDSAAE